MSTSANAANPPRRKRKPRSMLSAMAKGLGPAGVKRFPYIGSVISTVRSKRDDLTHIDQDFDLAAAITQTIQDHGSVNTTETMAGSSGSGGGRMHSHHMPLHEVVQKLRRQGVKEWKRVSATRVRTVLDKCAQLAPPDTIAVAGPEPVTGGLEADRGLVVQQAIDACSAVAQLRNEEKQAAGMQRFLPTLDHVRAASLSGSMTHTALHDLDTGMAAMARHWRPSAHNAGAVDALVAHVEALARAANPGSYVVARLFGSRSYGLCADHSDVDISVSVSAPRGSSTAAAAVASRNRAFFSDLARLLRRAAGFVHVVDVSHARVPIIKFVYMTPDRLRLEGDISLNGSKGLAKSRLVAAYLRLDPRVREVLAVLKLWAMRRNITCSTTLNSFGLLMMGVAYLVSRRVVPPLQLLATAQVSPQAWARLARIQHSPYKIAQLYPAYLNPSAAAADSGSAGGRHRCLQSAAAAAAATAAAQAALATSSPAGDSGSAAAVRCLQSGASLPEWPVEGTRAYYLNGGALNHWHSPNRDSAATLLFGMFQYYGFEFDPRAHAISPRLGSPAIARASLPHLAPPIDERLTIAEPNRWRNGLRLLAIEDPFDLTVNCGRSAPPEWVEGLLWEMRRAAWALLPPSASSSSKSTSSSASLPLDRLLLSPSERIFCDPGVWASAYHRAFQPPLPSAVAPVYDAAADATPERTVDLERLELAQLTGRASSPPPSRAYMSQPAPQPGQLRQTF